MKQRIVIALGLLVSLGLVVFFVNQLDWRAFAQEMHKVRFIHLPALVAILLSTFVIRALRWKYLLPGGGSFGAAVLTRAALIGALATFILPLRAGEVVRPWILSRRGEIGFPAALASIVVERVFDMLSILVLVALCMAGLENPPPAIVAGARALGLLAVVLVAGTMICYVAHATIRRWTEAAIGATVGRFSPRGSERIKHLANGLLDGLRAVRSLGDLLAVILWSALLWLTMAAWYQLALLAFGEQPPLLAGLLLNVAIALAVAAPSAPGFVGTYQAGCVLALAVLCGYSQEFAIAYSVVTHVIQIVTVIVAGFIALHREGLRFGSLRRKASASSQATTSRLE